MKLIKAEYECKKCKNKGSTIELRKVCCKHSIDNVCCGNYDIEQEQVQCICSITPFDIDIIGELEKDWVDIPF